MADVWALGCVIQLGTQRFCLRHLDRSNNPCGHLQNQKTMVARSVSANISEGYSRRASSAETQLRLYDVPLASLAKRAGDFRNFLLLRSELPFPSRPLRPDRGATFLF